MGSKPASRKWFRSRSVLLTWTLSYLAVLLLPVVLSAMVYVQSSRMLADEIHLANDSLLKQLRELMDKQVAAVNRLNFELSWNTKVRELVDHHKYATFPQEYMYDLHNATKDLVLYQSAYSEPDLFYVYLASQDTVLLPGVYRSTEFAYQEHHQGGDISYESWLETLRSPKFRGFIPLKRSYNAENPIDALAYVSTYDYQDGKPSGANVIMIDQAKILTAIRNIEVFSRGHVLIADDDNRLLVSSAASKLPARLPFGDKARENSMFLWESEDVQYEVFSIESGVSNLRYFSLIPSDLYWQKAERVRNLTFLSIAASLFGGGLLTYIFLRRNYNPIKRIVNAFKGKPMLRGQDERPANEFAFIQQAVDNTLNELDQMTLEMNKQRFTLRSNFMMRLLKGIHDHELPLAESLAAFDMEWLSEDFAVMVFYLEDVGVFLERIQGKTGADKQKLLHFIVTNVVEEMVNEHHKGYMTETDGLLTCLVSLSGGSGGAPDAAMEKLTKAACSAKAFLASQYSIFVAVTLSDVHRGTMHIPSAYQKALYAMEYKLATGGGDVMPYGEMHICGNRGDNDGGYHYPLQAEQQLMNFVKVGDYESARTLMNDILEQNLAKQLPAASAARFIVIDLAGTLVKCSGELGMAEGSNPAEQGKRMDKLASSMHLQEMRKQLNAMLKDVCAHAEARQAKNSEETRRRTLDQLVGDVSGFIVERCTDPDLNVSSLGRHFGMKPTYLSQLFKEQTGQSLLDAINGARIALAKELMAGERLTVGEAAEKSGFNDVGTFIRTFKKIEGITPGKYKATLDS